MFKVKAFQLDLLYKIELLIFDSKDKHINDVNDDFECFKNLA